MPLGAIRTGEEKQEEMSELGEVGGMLTRLREHGRRKSQRAVAPPWQPPDYQGSRDEEPC